jgi:hypothetical protein
VPGIGQNWRSNHVSSDIFYLFLWYQYATEIWNAIADGKKFSKGDKVIIHRFSWGLRVLVQETPVKIDRMP